MGHPHAHSHAHINWIGSAAYKRYLLNGNLSFISNITTSLADLYRSNYVKNHLVTMDGEGLEGQQCWKQGDGADAMEVSISGSGCRPTIASAMFGEADTIVKLAQLVGDQDLVQEFTAWRNLSRYPLT